MLGAAMLERKNIRPRAVIYGGLAFLIVLLLTLFYGALHIPRQLEQEARRVLEEAGLDPQTVSFEGRIAVLEGQVASYEESRRSAEILADMEGVFRVDNRLHIAGPRTPRSLETEDPEASPPAPADRKVVEEDAATE